MAKSVRLGVGAYTSREEKQEIAREHFLDTAVRLYPEILTELKDAGAWEEAGFAKRVERWARRWHIAQPWVVDIAKFNVWLWLNELSNEDGQFVYASRAGQSSKAEVLTLDWEPLDETEREFDDELAKRIAAYKRKRKQAMLARRSRRTTWKKRESFEWLVKHQVGGIGWVDIARQNIEPTNMNEVTLRGEASNIQRKAQEIGDLIGLKPRRGR